MIYDRRTTLGPGRLSFDRPIVPIATKSKAQRAAKVKRKADPRLVQAAREFWDRWMESGASQLPLPVTKYELFRALPDSSRTLPSQPLLDALPAAA